MAKFKEEDAEPTEIRIGRGNITDIIKPPKQTTVYGKIDEPLKKRIKIVRIERLLCPGCERRMLPTNEEYDGNTFFAEFGCSHCQIQLRIKGDEVISNKVMNEKTEEFEAEGTYRQIVTE